MAADFTAWVLRELRPPPGLALLPLQSQLQEPQVSTPHSVHGLPGPALLAGLASAAPPAATVQAHTLLARMLTRQHQVPPGWGVLSHGPSDSLTEHCQGHLMSIVMDAFRDKDMDGSVICLLPLFCAWPHEGGPCLRRAILHDVAGKPRSSDRDWAGRGGTATVGFAPSLLSGWPDSAATPGFGSEM